jgi:hypothetical protein
MNFPTPKTLIITLLFAGAASQVAAAQGLPFPEGYRPAGVTYQASVPTPAEVLGHRVGERHTRPHQIVEYFEAVDRASNRVVLGRHALSYEGRPLIHAIVTSPANQNRLEEIRTSNARLSDQPDQVSDADLETLPAVVYMGYSVHGNEASGSEAALLLLYHLAAGTGPEVESLLDSAIVIVDPSLNPDGRDRFTDWVNGQRGAAPTSDSQDREHNEPWPGGRTNHYWFDLNRDWLPVQHPESQGRVTLFHTWRPQLLTDFHEMSGNATYFFQPGIPSRNNPNSPEAVFDLTRRLAGFHAAGLDEVGTLYYAEESFDDFYYGKGSTYPDVNGAVGILFEQASSRALKASTVEGALSYERSVLNQFVASLTTLAGVRDMRVDFLRLQRDFYLDAPAVAGDLDISAYLVSLERRNQAQAMVAALQAHRIQIHALDRTVSIDGMEFRPGEAYVIPTDQPQVRLLTAAMERVTTFGDSLFYDVSTWSFPLAFGVEVAEHRGDAGGLVGDLLPPVSFDGGEVVGGPAGYAYLMPWDRFFAPRALYRLLEAGVYPRVARLPFTAQVAGRDTPFPRGTIIVPVTGRDGANGPAPDEIHALAQSMAAEDHVVLYGVASGATPSGPDLGGASTRVIASPRVALLTGPGQSAYEVGEIWHLLSERMQIPVSLIDAGRLDDIDLSRYNRLIAVNGFSPDSAAVAELLGDWIRDGGVFIAQRGAVRSAIDLGLVAEDLREAETDSAAAVSYGDVGRHRGAQSIGGAAITVAVDTTHPLGFGIGASATVFRRGTLFLEPSDTHGATVARYLDAPLASGYVSARNLETASGSASVVARRSGRGAVILLADVMSFRAFWWGSARFVTNAVFLGGAF